MPNIKSAKKRVILTEKKNLENRSAMNEVKTCMKKLNAALRDHTFDNGKFWKETTGKTAEELEADWKSETASSSGRLMGI